MPVKLNIKQRRAISALLCFMVLSLLKSQVVPNLVNNYSFEDTIQCPNNAAQVNFSKHWFDPIIIGSPDYFNTCANSSPTATRVTVPQNMIGYQFPRTGNAYCGFVSYANAVSNGREYIKNRLKLPLTNLKTYCITFYISRADSCAFASDNIGAYFSNDSIIGNSPPYLINAVPVVENVTVIYDTVNWVQVQGTYLASGTYNFITIGNFRNDLSTSIISTKSNGNIDLAYYYIDDVSVVEINPANAGIKDSLVSRCFMDSVILGTDSTEFATYTWTSTVAGLAALSCTDCPNPIAKPAVTTKYYLTKVQCSSTTMDSVTVVVLTPTTQANAGADKVICIGEYIQIGTQDSLAFTNYSWQFNSTLSCTNCAMPFAFPTISTTYTVQRTECANITTDTVRVIVDDCDPTLTIPNVFTPNYDDVNDTWGINFSTVNKHITNFKMSIYDRWGLLIYSTNSELSTPNSKWDGHTNSGEECSSGVYYYLITFEKNEEHVLLKGHLSLFK